MTEQMMRSAEHNPTIATKIAIVVRDDLPAWQKLNMTAFLASGIAASAPDSVGAPYRDADGTSYTPMFGQPVMVFTADPDRLTRTLNRALARGVVPAVFTAELFTTGHDEANRAAVAALGRDDINPIGLAVRSDRKTVDKIVDGLRLHR